MSGEICLAGGVIDRRRALVFSAPRRIEILDEPLARPAPGEALVATELSALSAGTELLAFRGELPPELPVDETLDALAGGATFRYPFRYGYASVGTVVAVGDGVAAAWIGRRVFAFQPHASAFVAPVAELAVIPDALPLGAGGAVSAHGDGAQPDPRRRAGDRRRRAGDRPGGDRPAGDGAARALSAVGAGGGRARAGARRDRAPLRGARDRRRRRRMVGAGRGARRRSGLRAVGRSERPRPGDRGRRPRSAHRRRILVRRQARADRSRRALPPAAPAASSAARSATSAPRCRRAGIGRVVATATWRALAAIDTTPLVSHRFPLAQAQRAYALADAGAGGIARKGDGDADGTRRRCRSC